MSNPYESPQTERLVVPLSLARRGIRLMLFGSASVLGFIGTLMLVVGIRLRIIVLNGGREPLNEDGLGLSFALLGGSAVLIAVMAGLIWIGRRVGRRPAA